MKRNRVNLLLVLTMAVVFSAPFLFTVPVAAADIVPKLTVLSPKELTVTAPIAGEMPDYTINNITNAIVSVSWSEMGTPLIAGDKFKKGEIYTATVTLTAGEGYIFSASAVGFKINGKTSRFVGLNETARKLTIEADFKAEGGEATSGCGDAASVFVGLLTLFAALLLIKIRLK